MIGLAVAMAAVGAHSHGSSGHALRDHQRTGHAVDAADIRLNKLRAGERGRAHKGSAWSGSNHGRTEEKDGT